MPRSSQDFFIHVLLLWLTVLSIIQAAFIIFFFTAGHHSPTKSSITGGPEGPLHTQTYTTASPSPPVHVNPPLVKGQMFTYKASEDNGEIQWRPRYPNNKNSVIIEKGQTFTIREDGYYFFNLQVTLHSSKCPCNGTSAPGCTVRLNYNGRDILMGWINTHTCSTGLLGKAEMLPRGATLKITEMPNKDINDLECLTHLDIIMLQSGAMLSAQVPG